MIVLRLAALSLWNRRVTAGLTALAVALSVALFLAVETVREGARDGFAGTISGTDLIVGARGGGVQLMLYSVFRIGNATNNLTWESYEAVAAREEVEWIVPLSLGDSHRGFRVVGTSSAFFERYRFGRDRALAFARGGPFDDLFDAAIGSEVAEALGYEVGSEIVVSHGLGRADFALHDDKPFRVSGVLERTGTPVDRSVHVSLEAIEAIHVDWQGGARIPGQTVTAEEVRAMDLRPRAVTAALVGLSSPLETFALQRWVNEYPEEPLTAVLPGVALQELWSVVGVAETALLVVSALVIVTALLGLATAILSTLEARRREMAILRAVGARPVHVLGLLVAEAMLVAAAGALLGAALVRTGLSAARPLVEDATGLYLSLGGWGAREAAVVLAVVAAGALAGVLPALRAYRASLADGMTVRM